MPNACEADHSKFLSRQSTEKGTRLILTPCSSCCINFGIMLTCATCSIIYAYTFDVSIGNSWCRMNFDLSLFQALYSSTDSVEDECSVCLTSTASCAILPCRHRCACENCITRLLYCPICRSTISSYFITGEQENLDSATESEEDWATNWQSKLVLSRNKDVKTGRFNCIYLATKLLSKDFDGVVPSIYDSAHGDIQEFWLQLNRFKFKYLSPTCM